MKSLREDVTDFLQKYINEVNAGGKMSKANRQQSIMQVPSIHI